MYDIIASQFALADETAGAVGVDMGRNIFQSNAPVAMIQAVGKVVHELMPPAQAFDFDQTLKREQELAAKKT